MAQTEDRRRITVRLIGAAGGRRRRRSPRSPSASGSSRSSSTHEFEEMAENNHQRTLALRAPRGVLFDRNGKVLVENRTRSPSRSSASTPRISIARSACCRTSPGSTRDRSSRSSSGIAASRATGRSSSSRTRRWRRWRRSRRGASISSCRTSSSRKCRRGSIPPTRWPRTCSATSARPAKRRSATASRSGAIVGQSGRREGLQQAADGRGRRQARRRQQHGPRDPRRSRRSRRSKGRRVQLTIDYDLQKAAEDGFRHAGFNGAALILDPRNGEVLTYASLPAYDPNDFAGGHRPRDVGVAQHRQAAAAAEPRASRAATRRARRSRSWSRRRRSRKGSSRRTSASTAAAARRSSAATSSAT